jgi:hypothetical protein
VAKLTESEYIGCADIHIRQNDMTTGKKFLFAIPWILQLFLIIVIEYLLLSNVDNPGKLNRIFNGGMPRSDMQLMLLCLLVTIVVDIVGRVVYIINAMHNTGLSQHNRTTWIIVLALLGMVVQIIFFFKYIRKTSAAGKAIALEQHRRDFWET